MPCTLYTVHCTCNCTLYTVHCTCSCTCTCACTYTCTCTCTCPQVHVPHLRYLQHLSSCRYLDNNVYSLDRVTALHRVTIVLAGSLQGGDQLPSTLPFLLAGGHLSHHCTLYTVHCTLYTCSWGYIQLKVCPGIFIIINNSCTLHRVPAVLDCCLCN